MRRSLVKLSGLVKAVTKMVTGCLRTMKVAKFVLGAKSCFSELRKICDFLYACHLLFRSRVYFTLSNLISLPWRRFGWVLFHHFRLIVYFCPQKCWFTLCNRAGGGSTGRRQTGATAQSTSALTLERSSIFYQTWKWLDLLKLARALKIVQSSSAAGMPLAIRASNSTSMRRWVSNTWNRTENYLERLFLRYHSKSYVRQRGVGGGRCFYARA